MVEDGAEQIAALAERALGAVDGGAAPGPELEALVRAVADRYATDRAFKAAAGKLEHGLEDELATAPPDSAVARATGAITALLDRARGAGAVRADTTPADLVLLLGAVPGPEFAPDRRARYLDIVLAGLRG